MWSIYEDAAVVAVGLIPTADLLEGNFYKDSADQLLTLWFKHVEQAVNMFKSKMLY